MTTAATHPAHEDRLRALEERLLEIAEAIHRLREDMAAGAEGEGDHDTTRAK